MSFAGQVAESAPLIVTFGTAIISQFYSIGKKWQNFIIFLLAALCVYFTYAFFCLNEFTPSLEHSFFDLSFNKITLFVGSIFCGSLFIGLFPVRKEITLTSRFILFVAGGIGVILANNLPTFFLFWTFQRAIPLVSFVRDLKNDDASGGGTYIFQHLLAFLCIVALLFLAWDAGFLITPLTQIPVTFFTWPVLILCFVIIYQSHGIFPFHSWVHDIMGHLAWYEISCIFLSRAGVLFFVQLLLPSLNQDPDSFKILLLTLSIISSIYWSFRGIFENNVNRIPTYFYVAQSSLIFTGLQADLTAARGSYLHMMVISLCGTALFSILNYIQTQFSLKRSSQFYGLAQYYPKLATLFCLFGFCMIGVPLGASFIVEDLVINGLLDQQPYLGLGHILATCLNGILFFLLFSKIFLGRTAYSKDIKNMDMKLGQMVPYLGTLALMLLIGIMPYLFLENISW
jgi:NADH:ubiquinone oxidoreductase subunit 4 (subunit M)